MPRHSPQQLLQIVAQLDQALENHEQWHKQVVRTLIARLPPQSADLLPDAHRHCRLGRWYDSDEAKSLADRPAFVALGTAHEQMHQTARMLLQCVVDNSPIPLDEIDAFSHLRDRVKLEIQSWRQELVDAVNNRDPLTGARNRVNMLADLREQLALVERGAQQCAIAIVDLDYFKEVNDRHGHLAGDAVLASTAECLEKLVRPYDRIYRYGGEEFLLCMPNTSVDAGVLLAERLRAAIAANEVQAINGPVLHITASFGVAALKAGQTVEVSIDQADKALYLAKSQGRNRVEAAR